MIRVVLKTDEFDLYMKDLPLKVQDKYDYVIQIIQSQYVVSEKFVKKIVDTCLYEVRISMGNNEYRTMLVAIDAQSFIESKTVILLNSFIKKDTKQYKSEIQKALSIINKMEG